MSNQGDRRKSEDETTPSLVRMSDIQKSFPGVQALKNAPFELRVGEIHALVGENGAGKSTLLKILSGALRPDSGKLAVLGKSVSFQNPLDAIRAGIATIYQEFTLVPRLSASANIFLGHEMTKKGLIDHSYERDFSQALLQRLGANIDTEILVIDLSLAHRQILEIARALARKAKVLIMDEPTAALAPREVGRLFDLLREIAGRGIGIIFVSHRLDEVISIADRITVMRDGVTISTRNAGDFNRGLLIREMVGRTIEHEYYKEKVSVGELCLEVNGLAGRGVKGVSFVAKKGEVIGIAGLLGAGKTETARLIFGADPKESGEILIDGKICNIDSPRAAIQRGICFLPEDRKWQGLILSASILENFAIPNLKKWTRWSCISQSMEESAFQKHVVNLGIKISDPSRPIDELSGGNQQKVLLARWLETDSRIILFDEPTRGIDVGAKYDIYVLIAKLVVQGKVVIVISSELEELLGICDRILVMRGGRISGEITDMGNATQDQIMSLAV